MIVRVKPVLAIPRSLKVAFNNTVTFNPDAELPDDVGRRLIKAQPDLYEAAEGKPDLSKYKQREGVSGTASGRPGLVLSDEEVEAVLKMREKKAPVPEEAPGPGAEEKAEPKKTAAKAKA